ncbi:MAG: hypothetical protein LUH15_04995 [Tannerellaceae bacterium]|nr:hypothetical protein [Tannerellaceae bacterium]
MNNNPIQSLWVGTHLSSMEILCINSYLANGHEFHLYAYNEILNVPEGTIVKDASEIIPKKDMYVDNFGGYVNLSNQFRFTMLYELGGWWVDMDTVCLKPFDFKEDFVFSSEVYGVRTRINNTYMKSNPGEKYLRDCLDFLSVRGHKYIHWGELGITLLSRMIFRNQMGQYIQQPDCFCPVPFYHIDQLIDNSTYVLPETSYALHLWHNMWKTQQINKDAEFPENSLYEKLKSKYIVQQPEQFL